METTLRHDNIESIWFGFFINKSKSFLISSIYKPPEGSKYLLKDFDESFDKMLSNVTSTKMEVILMGDCNVNFIKGANKCNFKSTLSLYGFEQLVKRATRITNESSTLIDIIATNKPSVLKSTDVIPTSLSDHDMVGCVRKLNHINFAPKVIKCRDFQNMIQLL